VSALRGPAAPAAASAPGAARASGAHARLRRLAHEMEGVFLDQLFKAMRASVPKGGLIDDAPGEEMFTSLMDERLASEAAERMRRGMGEALYRQLARRLPPEPDAEKP